jgi:hypothetical protein
LPVYLWGPAVRRALQASRRGFQLLATAHAGDAEEFVGMLAGYPLRVPLAEVGAFDLVVALAAWRSGGGIERVVSGVWQLGIDRRGEGLTLSDRLASSGGDEDWGRLGWVPADEIRARATALTVLVDEVSRGGVDRREVAARLAALGEAFAAEAPERGSLSKEGSRPS